MSDEPYIPEASFSSLVITLSSSAWVSLGKITDPVSGEVKKDLRSAKFSIDTLIMLREKTTGRLDDDENKLLNVLINDLQANYAESVFEQEKTAQKTAPAGNGADEDTSEEDAEASVNPEGDTGAAEQTGKDKTDKAKPKNQKNSKPEIKDTEEV
jgi:hypothetical protein